MTQTWLRRSSLAPLALATSSNLLPFTAGTQTFSRIEMAVAPSPLVGRVGAGGGAASGAGAGAAAAGGAGGGVGVGAAAGAAGGGAGCGAGSWACAAVTKPAAMMLER